MDVNKGLESGVNRRYGTTIGRSCRDGGASQIAALGAPPFMGLSSGSVVLSAATSASADFVIEALNKLPSVDGLLAPPPPRQPPDCG